MFYFYFLIGATSFFPHRKGFFPNGKNSGFFPTGKLGFFPIWDVPFGKFVPTLGRRGSLDDVCCGRGKRWKGRRGSKGVPADLAATGAARWVGSDPLGLGGRKEAALGPLDWRALEGGCLSWLRIEIGGGRWCRRLCVVRSVARWVESAERFTYLLTN